MGEDFRVGLDVQVLVYDGDKWPDINPVCEPNFYIGDGTSSYLVTPRFAVMYPKSRKRRFLPDVEKTLRKIEDLGGWRPIYREQEKVRARSGVA